MNVQGFFRFLFAAVILSAFWLRYRAAKVRPFKGGDEGGFQEVSAFLVAALADGAAIVFGTEYLLRGGLFTFAYELAYPLWLRGLGVAVGLAGLGLLRWSWVHLRGEHTHVEPPPASEVPLSGPYRWIRHPVYVATLLTNIGAGLLSSNWVLTFVPALLHLAAMLRRIPREEAFLQEALGARDVSYMQRTGMIFPSVNELWGVGLGTKEGPPERLAEGNDHFQETSKRGN